MYTQEQLENIFSYHAPNERQVEVYQELRNAAKRLAILMESYGTDCDEKKIAMERLMESNMWINAAIARHGLHPNCSVVS